MARKSEMHKFNTRRTNHAAFMYLAYMHQIRHLRYVGNQYAERLSALKAAKESGKSEIVVQAYQLLVDGSRRTLKSAQKEIRSIRKSTTFAPLWDAARKSVMCATGI